MKRPDKPHPDFPLFANQNGQWCKKINRKPHYFGPWRDDPKGKAALAEYERQRPFLEAGKEPPPRGTTQEPTKGSRGIQRPRPAKGSPLKAAANGMWVWYPKKMNFGSWRAGVTAQEAEAARQHWVETGRKPGDPEKLTVHIAVNQFLTEFQKQVQSKEQRATDGERRKSRSPWTHRQYKTAGKLMIDVLGRHTPLETIPYEGWKELREAIDAKPVSEHTIKKHLTGIWRILNHAKQLAERNGHALNLRIADALDKPSEDDLRKALQQREPRFFRRDEILAVLKKADVQMKAVTLLGINAAFHNMDFALLEFRHLNLDKAQAFFPRSKNQKGRFVILWPETVTAIRNWMAQRPEPTLEVYRDRVFVDDESGHVWVRNQDDTSPLTRRYNALLEGCTVKRDGKEQKVKRSGISVGQLRHTFKTVANALGHKETAKIIMGHTEPLTDMDSFYVANLDDSLAEIAVESAEQEQIRNCVNAVRGWLYGQTISSNSPQ